jgi:pimeloyl-[acyl-carrier protein] methyl ester esterase
MTGGGSIAKDGQITLVLLPGMDGTGSLFGPFAGAIAALGDAFSLKIVSYPRTGPQTYARLQSWASAALPVEGPLVLLGESFSGPIAIALAAQHPSRVIGLVLCCTFARNPRPRLGWIGGLASVLPAPFPPLGVLSHFLLGRFATPALRLALASALAQTAPAVLRARLRSVITADVSTEAGRIKVPVLCLRASEDRTVPPSAAAQLERFFPAMEVLQVEGPHCLLQTAPDVTAAAISAFVRELMPARKAA